MKRIILITFAFILIFIGALTALASSSARNNKNVGLLVSVEENAKKLRFDSRITGTLNTNSDSFLIVKSGTKSYDVFISPSTQIRPRFWGKINLNELTTGDNISVIGTWRNAQKTQINATLVRDLSIERRWAVTLGDIVSKDTNSFVLRNANRGEITIKLDNQTKFVTRSDKKSTLSDLKVGDRVRVKGIYDQKMQTITDVSEIKNFSR